MRLDLASFEGLRCWVGRVARRSCHIANKCLTVDIGMTFFLFWERIRILVSSYPCCLGYEIHLDLSCGLVRLCHLDAITIGYNASCFHSKSYSTTKRLPRGSTPRR